MSYTVVRGYGSIMNVPRVFTYAEAKSLFDSIKPLRGRSVEIRPLGSRRNADQYRVRMKDNDVEFILYHTPVITYKSNGDVTLQTDGWNTSSTHQFITHVLKINCYGSRSKSVIEVDLCRYIIGDGLTLGRRDGDWCVLSGGQDLYDWRIDRKSANNVRGRYSEFYKYFKGFLNLRAYELVEKGKYFYDIKYQAVSFSLQEAINLLGSTNHRERGCLEISFMGTEDMNNKSSKGYDHSIKSLLSLIENGQGESAYHNFYRVSMLLLLHLYGDNSYQKGDESRIIHIRLSGILPLFDTVLFKRFSDEVLVWQKLAKGKLPTEKYLSWVTTLPASRE